MKWEKVKLVDICNPKQWKTISTDMLTQNGYPVYGANGIIGFYKDYTHESPTVMITCRGETCGNVHISKPFSYINGNAMALDNLSSKVSLRYLYYFLLAYGFKNIISGSAQPQITIQGLQKLEIPLPPLHIQEQIADTLDKADALRRKDQELLQKYEELAQAIFYDMFGDPVRNEKGWDVKKLLEVSRVFTGGTPARSNPEYFTGRIPWVTSVALNNIFINDSNAQGYITEDAIAESSTKKVKEGSLCFGIRVGVGKCSITQTELCINQDIAAITDFSSHCTPLFLRSVIKSFSNYFESIQKGATIQGVTTGDLKQLDIILPELSVQYVYDEKLKNILSQETSATHNKENVNALFLGILSQHFS